MTDRMLFHSVDYREDRGGRAWLNRGWWLHGTPRLMPLCRLRGHRPVVDGVDFTQPTRLDGRNPPPRRSRWACCDRCGIRLLQPVDSDLELGQPYTGPLPAPRGAEDVTGARGVVGGQVVIGGAHDGVAVEVKVGNAGSEHTLEALLHLGRALFVAVHTERHGTWLQRRLNPVGYESRVIGLDVHDGRLSWKLWARRDAWSRSDPWWMSGSVRINPIELIFGPTRYTYTDVGDPVQGVVRMPAGDDHLVRLQLQRQARGRDRLKRRALSWIADWSTMPGSEGVPVRSHRGGVTASAVALSATTDPDDTLWVAEACAAIAVRLTRDRARYGYRPRPASA